MLIKLTTTAFKKASWPTSIQTGRDMYPLANNLRNAGLPTGDSRATFETRRSMIQDIRREFEV